jgi:hypothetical protein
MNNSKQKNPIGEPESTSAATATAAMTLHCPRHYSHRRILALLPPLPSSPPRSDPPSACVNPHLLRADPPPSCVDLPPPRVVVVLADSPSVAIGGGSRPSPRAAATISTRERERERDCISSDLLNGEQRLTGSSQHASSWRERLCRRDAIGETAHGGMPSHA